jgi:membrane protease YdiL (CAAX protease family)
VFGYLRARYRTLWYSIFAHFTYNTSIVLIEYFNLWPLSPINFSMCCYFAL